MAMTKQIPSPRTLHALSRPAAAPAPGLAAAVILSLLAVGCGGGGEEPAPPSSASAPPAAAPRNPGMGSPIAAPGSDLGLATDGSGGTAGRDGGDGRSGSGGGMGGGDAGEPAREAAPAWTPPPPRANTSLPQPKEGVEQAYGEAAPSLARDSQDTRFTEFRGVMERNSSMMVEVARARDAMRRGVAGAEAAYLDLNRRYAELSDAIAAYMAQPRWNARDREVMGYLYSLSNEEAVRRVRSGS